MSARRLIVFRNRVRPGEEAAYAEAASGMYALAEQMPGFVASKDFVAEDGERLALIEFDSAEHLAAWRHHPDHARAQADGRSRWYTEYSLDVCDVVRSSRFDAATGTWERSD
ncbi:MAG: antibiotic biosynthesis monooxygenase [Deltaproteobacteria bacterium]|nr:antibiotic biosynthesis monooxygenase [Kofleriaceae bacterium]